MPVNTRCVAKLSVHERRILHTMGVKTFVQLANLKPTLWKDRLGVSTFTNKTLKKPKIYDKGTIKNKLFCMYRLVYKMRIRDKVLLDIYHYKSHVDKGTRILAGSIYLNLHPNAIMPPML